jgi:hypothetical protein
MQSARYCSRISPKIGTYQKKLVKPANIKFHGNMSSHSRVVMYVQTDGRSDFNRRSTRLRTRLQSDTDAFQMSTTWCVIQHFFPCMHKYKPRTHKAKHRGLQNWKQMETW